ncbi:MAG: hypothetical protein BGO76_00645 [Caedibacter sp. 38-128]|nr:helix-turn-helix domain-containing protein [Holosporales bacterium]OJX08094.1 MAG: hypothetical protein BGO76_00645 [Caedibacter sp. 38-128]
MENQFLTPAALAQRWNLEPNTLGQWRWNGRGPKYLKIGRRVLYRLCDVEEFEKRSLRQHTSQTFVDESNETSNFLYT